MTTYSLRHNTNKYTNRPTLYKTNNTFVINTKHSQYTIRVGDPKQYNLPPPRNKDCIARLGLNQGKEKTWSKASQGFSDSFLQKSPLTILFHR